MNIKELKELIENLPNEMPVENCCGGEETAFEVIKSYRYNLEDDSETDYEYLWVGPK